MALCRMTDVALGLSKSLSVVNRILKFKKSKSLIFNMRKRQIGLWQLLREYMDFFWLSGPLASLIVACSDWSNGPKAPSFCFIYGLVEDFEYWCQYCFPGSTNSTNVLAVQIQRSKTLEAAVSLCLACLFDSGSARLSF